MATLKDIRKRITSVRNTQKITNAMKMVAAAKLRRAQMAVVAARPYANKLKEVICSVAAIGDPEAHPLFVGKVIPRRASFLLYTSNRGLCGGFNSNLLRRTETYLKVNMTQYELIDLKIIGRKGRDFFHSRKKDPSEVFIDYADSFPFEGAEKISQGMIEGFIEGDFDEYYLVYNRFKSALTQEVQIEKLIPVSVEKTTGQEIDYLYEPNRKEVLNSIIPKYLATQLYRAHLESLASELGARMTAMESATNNASEMIDSLTLQYNRLRQAAITKELMDIVNGAEAMK